MAELITLAHHNRDQDAVAIGGLYERARSSVVDNVRHLIEAGQRLARKKKTLGRGQWLPWLEANADLLGFKGRTARLLIGGAAKWQSTANLNEADAVEINRMIWGNTTLRGTAGTGDNEWFTPPEYIAAVREVLGEIDLDPASHVLAQQTIVKAIKYFTREHDGLRQDWHGRVWLNPPYAREEIGPFVEKLVYEIDCGNVSAAIMLTHNYTDTEWFEVAASCVAALCFTEDRIKFLKSDGKPANPTQGQVFFYFGNDVAAFARHFVEFGFVLVPYDTRYAYRA